MIAGGSALVSGIYYVFASLRSSFGSTDEVRASSDPTGIRWGKPGWFSDPFKEAVFRHWDGERWTRHIGDGSQHFDGRPLTELESFSSTRFLSAQNLAHAYVYATEHLLPSECIAGAKRAAENSLEPHCWVFSIEPPCLLVRYDGGTIHQYTDALTHRIFPRFSDRFSRSNTGHIDRLSLEKADFLGLTPVEHAEKFVEEARMKKDNDAEYNAPEAPHPGLNESVPASDTPGDLEGGEEFSPPPFLEGRPSEIEARLETINELLTKGLISSDEATARRIEILREY